MFVLQECKVMRVLCGFIMLPMKFSSQLLDCLGMWTYMTRHDTSLLEDLINSKDVLTILLDSMNSVTFSVVVLCAVIGIPNITQLLDKFWQ